MKPNSRAKLLATLLGLFTSQYAAAASADDVAYVPDANGRTKTVTGAGWSIVYDYDAAGNVTRIARTAPISLLDVVSRKVHGAEPHDLSLNRFVQRDGAVTVEPRNIGGGHMIVFQFNSPISNPGVVSVCPSGPPGSGNVQPSLGNVLAVAASGTEVQATIANIPDTTRVTVSLTGVNGGAEVYSASVGFLRGDVNNTRGVNASDIAGVKANVGKVTTSGNFTLNINPSTEISIQDVSSVKSQTGRVLGP